MRLPHRIFAGRPRFAAALIVVVVAAVLLTAAAFLVSDEFTKEVLINLGATALGVFLTALVLEPLIERARRPEEIIYSAFPHQHYIAGVARARRAVRIMGAWPYVMDPPWRTGFLAACRTAVKRGVHLQILVLDPLSHAALQRRHDLDNQIDVSGIIADTLSVLKEFSNSLEAAVAERFEVRVYSSLPPARLYSYDQRALCSFFPLGSNLGTDVRHYETNVTSGLARFVDEQFQTVWQHTDTQSLSDYLHLMLRAASSDRDHLVQHVAIDGELYAASSELVDDLFRNSPQEQLIHARDALGNDRPSYSYQAVADLDPSAGRILAAFEMKYGSHSALLHGFQSVIRLLES